MADHNLNALIQRRDRLRENVQRVQGRLDSARRELALVEDECRKKKVDPQQIDAVIDQLQQRLTQETARLAQAMSDAEGKIAPFLEER